ncbi:IS200/IS605 family transposase [Candidatus Sumerlaeota bacterium]|nr:IS200/IS605 family transposase [Candidatus Sumerlaeota bacterium]
MSSYVQTYYHIVYSTKNRIPALVADQRPELFRYMWGILKNKKSHLYRLNGTEDHLHMLTSLHPTVALADLIRDMKTSSAAWIKKEKIFPDFPGWQVGYGGFTKSHADKDKVTHYIMRQEEHHRKVSFIDEFKQLLAEEGIEFDERFLK